ncbi:MAG: copper resistance protein NlpE [Methylococcales bacterium]|nr:copper resistance protein NlpE [Methylococcales bacterium]
MKNFLKSSQTAIILFLLGLLVIYLNPFKEKSDMEIMAVVQENRAKLRSQNNDIKPPIPLMDEGHPFRGVFYGYLPCDDCAGVKMTLSLKNKQNYLLVTQYARSSNKEYYNKGKYEWDEQANIVTLTSRKEGEIQKYQIKDEGELILLKPNGMKLKGNQNQYSLLRTDKNKARSVHIH